GRTNRYFLKPQVPLLLAERAARHQWFQADKARIEYRRLAVLHVFAVFGIGDHCEECSGARIFRNKRKIPFLVGGSRDDNIGTTGPHLLATDSPEDRPRCAAVFAVCFTAAHALSMVWMTL